MFLCSTHTHTPTLSLLGMTAETLGSHGDRYVVVTLVVVIGNRVNARVPALAVMTEVSVILKSH